MLDTKQEYQEMRPELMTSCKVESRARVRRRKSELRMERDLHFDMTLILPLPSG